MSFLLKTFRASLHQINTLLKGNSNLTVARFPLNQPKFSFHISSTRFDVFEFFDDNKNWNENEVKHGRAWLKPELRIKSSSDLHKLWYILLKERNLLLTMENECKRLNRLFPSPERVDKIKTSMQNLETVVKERNQAYYELEIGERVYVRENEKISTVLGVDDVYCTKEYRISKAENEEWKRDRQYNGSNAISKFLKFYREKHVLKKTKEKNRQRNEVIHLLKRFPKLNIALLRKKFSDVDIDKIIKRDAARGHHIQKVHSINK